MRKRDIVEVAVWAAYVLIAVVGAWIKFDWAAAALVLLGALFGARVYAGLRGTVRR